MRVVERSDSHAISGVQDVSQVIAKIAPADHGRLMDLTDFDRVEVQEGYLDELGRGRIVVSDVPGADHLAMVLDLRDQLIVYKASHPGVISADAGGGECKILLSEVNSERHPDVAVYTTPSPTGGDVWSIRVPARSIKRPCCRDSR